MEKEENHLFKSRKVCKINWRVLFFFLLKERERRGGGLLRYFYFWPWFISSFRQCTHWRKKMAKGSILANKKMKPRYKNEQKTPAPYFLIWCIKTRSLRFIATPFSFDCLWFSCCCCFVSFFLPPFLLLFVFFYSPVVIKDATATERGSRFFHAHPFPLDSGQRLLEPRKISYSLL